MKPSTLRILLLTAAVSLAAPVFADPVDLRDKKGVVDSKDLKKDDPKPTPVRPKEPPPPPKEEPKKDAPQARLDPKLAELLARLLETRKIAMTNGNINVRESAPSNIFKRPGDSVGVIPAGTPVKIIERETSSTLFSTQEWVKVEVLEPKESGQTPLAGWVYQGKLPNGEAYLETPDSRSLISEFGKASSLLKDEAIRQVATDTTLLQKLKTASGGQAQ